MIYGWNDSCILYSPPSSDIQCGNMIGTPTMHHFLFSCVTDNMGHIRRDVWCIKTNHDNELVMKTSSNGNIFRVISPLWGESTGHRWIPLTKASDAELWCFRRSCLTKRLGKKSRRWWLETPSRAFWRHRYVLWHKAIPHFQGWLIID